MLSVRGESEVAIGGVQIGLSPITRENESHFPQIARPVTWRQPQAQPPSQMGQARPAVRSAERSGFVELIPLPAFFVGIANNTGAAISFTQAKIEVEDNAHRPYSVVLNPEVLRQTFFAEITGANPFVAGDRQLMNRLTQQIATLPLFSPNLVVANGEIWRGYLVLDVDARSTREYYSLMKSIQAFTIRLRDVPISAGTSTFIFAVDKSERPTMLTCPGEIREPAPEWCTPDPSS